MEDLKTPLRGRPENDRNLKIARYGRIRHLEISLRILEDKKISPSYQMLLPLRSTSSFRETKERKLGMVEDLRALSWHRNP